MRLCTFSLGGEPRAGASSDSESIVDIAAAADALGVQAPGDGSLRDILEAGADALDAVRGLLERSGDEGASAWTHTAGDVTLHHPYRPRKNIIRAGDNSTTMSGNPKTAPGATLGPGRWLSGFPVRYYTKAPSAVADPGQEITWPSAIAHQVYAEAQLAIIIGRETVFTNAEDALAGIAGYAVATDVISYDLKLKHGQFPKAVSLDSFFPWGPFIVTADEVPDPDALDVTLSLNGRPAHGGSTSDTVLSVGEMLAQISFGITLEPGDVLLLGAAECVGFAQEPMRWLAAGDVVESSIDGIGSISNSVAPY